MTKLTYTKRAYDKLADLIDQEIRKRSGSAKDLERFRQSLDVAFYLLGWAQFEYLVRKEAEDQVSNNARAHGLDGHAWRFLKENMKSLSVRRRLDIIFHAEPKARSELDRDYDVRNDAAHDYKHLPQEVRDISAWLGKLETLVDKF
ncbi:hypothetical protein NL532_11775 [Mesorhizobium sp. C120A]|uniref:hypothetical protein n=1 Tax=unclassified Mesorhizobium TaxID=325217 RepID=UPI0009DEBBBE|nr:MULTISPECIES: hypothetical protein [unclassified Mesorhizobium]WJI47250.1 hypothetical protein NL532_11775 [Mesorhizobium sp. C120A]